MLPLGPAAKNATGLFCLDMDAPGSNALPGSRPKREVAMKFLIVMIIVRFLIALFAENKAGNVENAGDANVNDDGGIHPAEYELRDHYFMRCSE